jgi:cellulose synthase/poly-beta-1,6-N-acetylglucosamine synthase-like glycosyltransferase
MFEHFAPLILILLAIILAVPSFILLLECLAGAMGGDPTPGATSGPRPRLAVLVPAHDEESGIGATVTALRADLADGDFVLVVADNCSDGTAAVAAGAGARVIERRDPLQRGKGFALAFGIKHLAANAPQVVVVVDADCRVAAGGMERLARRALVTGRPVQAEYLLRPPLHPDSRTAISGLALVVRNQVRPRGLWRLHLPCQLTGSGMAFAWALLRDASALNGNLVEDMALGIELATRGSPPLPCPEVAVWSELPEGGRAQLVQRRRWEHGHLTTLLAQGPRLLAVGLMRLRIDLVAMALDLMVPPLAMLVVLLGTVTAVSLLAWLSGALRLPLVLALASTGAVALAVMVSWLRFARGFLSLRSLLGVPLYVVWKLPLYLSYLVRGKHKDWERTARKSDKTGSAPPPL